MPSLYIILFVFTKVMPLIFHLLLKQYSHPLLQHTHTSDFLSISTVQIPLELKSHMLDCLLDMLIWIPPRYCGRLNKILLNKSMPNSWNLMYSTRDFTNVIKLMMLRWRVYPVLFGWISWITIGNATMEAEMWVVWLQTKLAASRSWKRQGMVSPFESLERVSPSNTNFSPLRPISEFWPPEL